MVSILERFEMGEEVEIHGELIREEVVVYGLFREESDMLNEVRGARPEGEMELLLETRDDLLPGNIKLKLVTLRCKESLLRLFLLHCKISSGMSLVILNGFPAKLRIIYLIVNSEYRK